MFPSHTVTLKSPLHKNLGDFLEEHIFLLREEGERERGANFNRIPPNFYTFYGVQMLETDDNV